MQDRRNHGPTYPFKIILEDELMATIECYGLDPSRVIFQHDNDSKHTAKSVRKLLDLQEFSVIKWPAHSSDLNPIKHLWSHMNRELNKDEKSPKGMLELWERAESELEKRGGNMHEFN